MLYNNIRTSIQEYKYIHRNIEGKVENLGVRILREVKVFSMYVVLLLEVYFFSFLTNQY